MRKILVVVVALFVLGCQARERAEDRCKADCPTYGASFVKVSCDAANCDTADENWECWCRRGAESGQGSDPLRIW